MREAMDKLGGELDEVSAKLNLLYDDKDKIKDKHWESAFKYTSSKTR